MNKPYIKSLLLGSTVQELIDEIDDGEILPDFEAVGGLVKNDWWEKFIKLLLNAEDRNIKFVCDVDSEFSETYAPKLKELDPIHYDQENWPCCENDVRILNIFIRDFYGSKDKKPKSKVTNEQYLKKPGYCPACESKNTRQDGEYFEKSKFHRYIGCDDCNAQWTEVYELSGFKSLGTR